MGEKFFRSVGGDFSLACTTLGPCSQSNKRDSRVPGPKPAPTCTGEHRPHLHNIHRQPRIKKANPAECRPEFALEFKLAPLLNAQSVQGSVVGSHHIQGSCQDSNTPVL